MDIYRDPGSYTPTEPIGLAEAKSWLLVDFTQDDTLITSLISYCRALIEEYCHVSIIPYTVTATLPSRPLIPGRDYPYGVSRWDLQFYGYTGCNNWQRMEWGPVNNITSFTSVQDNGTVTSLVLNQDYYVRGTQFKEFKYNNFTDTIMVVYKTGFAVCPPTLKMAILNELAERYTNRGDQRNVRYGNTKTLCDKAILACNQFNQIWI